MKIRQIMIVILAVTIGAVLFIPFANAIGSNTGTQTVTNETATADIGNYTDLGGYDIDGTTVTVYDDGTTVSDADYVVNESEGAIKIETSASLTDGEQFNVSYDYQATDSQTTTVATLLPLLLALLLLVTLAGRIMTKM